MGETTAIVLTFHYRGYYEDGEMFCDSTNGDPLTITTGRAAIVPRLEQELLDMQPGEEREVFAPQAYGPYDESAVRTRIMKYTIPHGDELEEGMQIMWTSPQNPMDPIPAKIVRADEYSFDIDFNHPLAGKDLTYWLKLVERSEA